MNKFGQKYQCKLPLQVKTLFFIFLQNGGKKLNNPVGKIAIGLKKHFNLMFSVQFLLFIFLRAHFSFSTPLPEFIFFKIVVGTLFALGTLRGKALLNIFFLQANNEDSEGSGTAEPEPEINVAALIEPLHSSPCLVRTKDWWTYQVIFHSR